MVTPYFFDRQFPFVSSRLNPRALPSEWYGSAIGPPAAPTLR